MKAISLLLAGALAGTLFYACAGGQSSPKYKEYPVRADKHSFFQKCDPPKEGKVCKIECLEFGRDNKCKKENPVEKDVNKLVNVDGFIVLDPGEYFTKLGIE